MAYESHPSFTTTASQPSNASTEETQEFSVKGKPSVYKRLRDLFVSQDNVRKSGKSLAIPELAELIAAEGLLNALHVSIELDQTGTPTGRSGVEAGGRRYRALMQLVDTGRASLDDLIECKEVEAGKATDVSLTENWATLAMHKADEYTAFQTLADEGRTHQAIAARYSVSVADVKRSLRLANVHPELMTLFRTDAMTLDQVMALASVEDQERQLLTWNSLPPGGRHASTLKRKLAEDTVEMDDPRVKLIGMKNYVLAGGATETDLFAEGPSKTLTDPALVEMLLWAAVQAKADEVKIEGWAFVATFNEYTHAERTMYRQMPKRYNDETPAQADERAAIEAQVLELEDAVDALHEADDTDWDVINAKEAEVEGLGEKLEALRESRVCVEDFDKDTCGAVVAFEGHAGIVVYRGMVEAAKLAAGPSGSASGVYDAPKKEKPEIPERLMLNLTSHRTAAVQASMLTNQAVTLAALANTMAQSVKDYRHHETPLKITLRECEGDMKRNSNTFDGSPAALAITAARETWKATLPQNRATWFAWFLEQPHATVLDFIVFASAVTASVTTSTKTAPDGADALVRALELDMSQWWQATPATYFELVPMSKLTAIVQETSTEEAVAAMGKMKKADAIAHAVVHTAGKAWLPTPLRQPTAQAVAAQDADDDSDQDEEPAEE